MGALGNVIDELMAMVDSPTSTIGDLEDIVLKIGVVAESPSVLLAARLVLVILDGRQDEAIALAVSQLVALALAEDHDCQKEARWT